MRTNNKIEIFALPDCTDCDEVAAQLTAKNIAYTLVYDQKVAHRANQLGKCAAPQTPCEFIPNQRNIALQKSGVDPTIKYPLVFHNAQYIPLEDLAKHDFLNPVTATIKPAIIVYSSGSSCFYCHLAKELLREKNIKFIEKEQKDDPFPEKCGQELRSGYPKIYINDECIGGFNELKTLNQTGQLDRYITPASATSKTKTTTSRAPIQDKPATQATTPINQELVLSENSLRILLALAKPIQVQDEIQKKLLEASQYGQFMLWVKMQGLPLKTMLSWKTPAGKPFLQELPAHTCSPLIWETIIREAGSENINTIKSYLDPYCSANQEITDLFPHYSSKQGSYCQYSPRNQGIAPEAYCEEKESQSMASQSSDQSDHVATWGKMLAVQSGVGALQGFMSALVSLIMPTLENSNFAKQLPQLRGSSPLSFLLSAFIQACSALVLYPVLAPTVWRKPEELESHLVQAEALATYFVSTFLSSLAVQLGIHELQQWIENDSGVSSAVKPTLKSIIPYLDSLDNLLPRLLSYSTYAHAGIEAAGFAANQASRWMSRGLSLFAFNFLKKCLPATTSTPSPITVEEPEKIAQTLPLLQQTMQPTTVDNDQSPVPNKPNAPPKPARQLRTKNLTPSDVRLKQNRFFLLSQTNTAQEKISTAHLPGYSGQVGECFSVK